VPGQAGKLNLAVYLAIVSRDSSARGSFWCGALNDLTADIAPGPAAVGFTTSLVVLVAYQLIILIAAIFHGCVESGAAVQELIGSM
jgi:hypothetical protein